MTRGWRDGGDSLFVSVSVFLSQSVYLSDSFFFSACMHVRIFLCEGCEPTILSTFDMTYDANSSHVADRIPFPGAVFSVSATKLIPKSKWRNHVTSPLAGSCSDGEVPASASSFIFLSLFGLSLPQGLGRFSLNHAEDDADYVWIFFLHLT